MKRIFHRDANNNNISRSEHEKQYTCKNSNYTALEPLIYLSFDITSALGFFFNSYFVIRAKTIALFVYVILFVQRIHLHFLLIR